MLNQARQALMLLIASVLLVACHKPPILDNDLALETLRQQANYRGYATNIVSNNPNAYGKNASGWTCADQSSIVEAGLASCEKSGRSGAYLHLSDSGKKLLIGQPWGDSNLRNARVIAITPQIESVDAINFSTKSKAEVSYTWSYERYTAFATEPLKKLIPLNAAQRSIATLVLIDKQWHLQP